MRSAGYGLKTDSTLDVLKQALWAREVTERLIHHSDRSKGDSYDNAMAETINGLYKAEAIHKDGRWRSIEQVELATLDWVDWFNNHRIMEPL